MDVRVELLARVRSCTSKVGMQGRLKHGAFVDSWLLWSLLLCLCIHMEMYFLRNRVIDRECCRSCY